MPIITMLSGNPFKFKRIFTNIKDLSNDLACSEIAFEAHQRGQAEFAIDRAANLA